MIQKTMVVGAPRSGFTLLISIIIEILLQENKLKFSIRQRCIQIVVDLMGKYLSETYKSVFADHGIYGDLLISGEFGFLLGGPKWIDSENPDRICVRKYIGVRDVGDFLFVTYHPKEIFEYYAVLHSHDSPVSWLENEWYDAFIKLTSVRHPVGIINSSCHSINALSSEYIQRYVDEKDVPGIRTDFALYKLTDLKLFHSLVRYLRNYFDDYFQAQAGYKVMKWEKLIVSPEKTIDHVAQDIGIDTVNAGAIWEKLADRNLTAFHQHNYRPGNGKLNDWQNYMINEHLEIMREYELDRYSEMLGYNPAEYLDERYYNDFQKTVKKYIVHGEYCNRIDDENLFEFGFNKTNIDPADYQFKSLQKMNHTHLERYNFSNEFLLHDFSNTSDAACAKVNSILKELNSAFLEKGVILKTQMKIVERNCAKLLGKFSNHEIDNDLERLSELVDTMV